MKPSLFASALIICWISLSMAAAEVQMPIFPSATSGWLADAEAGRAEDYHDHADFVAQQNFIRRTYLGVNGPLNSIRQKMTALTQRCQRIESEADIEFCRDQILSVRGQLTQAQLSLYNAFHSNEYRSYEPNRSPELNRLILDSDRWRAGLVGSIERVDQLLNRLKETTISFYRRHVRSEVERLRIDAARDTLCRLRPQTIQLARSTIRVALSSAVQRKDPWMFRVAEHQIAITEGDVELVRRLCPSQVGSLDGVDQALAGFKNQVAQLAAPSQVRAMLVSHCQGNIHPALRKGCQEEAFSDDFLYALHLAIRGRLQ